MHERDVIRERVVARLKGATNAGAEVYNSRPWKVWPEHVPLIVVYTPRDTLELHRQAPRMFKGTCEVQIDVFAAARPGATPPEMVPAHVVLGEVLEQVVVLIETDPLLRDPTTREPAAAQSLNSGLITAIETDFDAGEGVVVASGRVSVRYEYLREAATAPIPPALELDTVNTEYENPAGNNTTPEAVDSIDLV